LGQNVDKKYHVSFSSWLGLW